MQHSSKSRSIWKQFAFEAAIVVVVGTTSILLAIAGLPQLGGLLGICVVAYLLFVRLRKRQDISEGRSDQDP